VEIPELTGRIGSTSASLHHGPTQVLMETAATEAAAQAAGTDRLMIRQWYVAFVARGKTGPFVPTTEVVSVRPDSVAVEAVFRDEGEGGRIIASATAVFTRV